MTSTGYGLLVVMAALVIVLAVHLARTIRKLLAAKASCAESMLRLQQSTLRVAELERERHIDHLTGLMNRPGLTALLETEVARASRTGGHLSLLFLDIDHFKQVNDSLGHQTGDAYLQEISLFLSGASRKAETVARWGGEEFVVALVDADLNAAKLAADRYRSLIELAFSEHDIPVTVSIGVAGLRQLGVNTAAGLIAAADGAMYQAKDEGRNRWCLYDQGATPRVRETDG